ncbi:MAG: glutamate-5-semialdehyde dehydrogenase [Myxococcales bacterium]|nr:glutamate-5-semialdehyde dehydrogenase [Myxococcales bacterium]
MEAVDLGRRARAASQQLARASAAARGAALVEVAALLRDPARQREILAANQADLAEATPGATAAFLDRLRLDDGRLSQMATAVAEVARLPDPIGEVVSTWRRPNGLRVCRVRIPLGVVLVIYESRPNVTTDAGALCIRSGNAVILRGGREAHRTNLALGALVAEGLRRAGLPEDAALLCPTTDRAFLRDLLQQHEYIDLCIPRGGEGLIRFVVENARVPVIKHYRGNCHIYVQESADLEMALDICYNAKVQRPGVCNAVETILIDKNVAPRFLPLLHARLSSAGVELRGDERARALVPDLTPATEEDFRTEYLDLICAVGIVDGLEEAVAHIEKYGSNHTEAIITRDLREAERFVSTVHSSTVLVNASTRFADGGELGLGAEIGISTSRLHAYGPMGAEQLTTTKFVVYGDGQTRT